MFEEKSQINSPFRLMHSHTILKTTATETLLYFTDYLKCFFLQQAFNATVAIHHMKKLQMAHSEASMRQNQTPPSVPEINVITTSTPEAVHKKLFTEIPESNHNTPSEQMNIPSSSTESKNQYHPVRVSHSETTHVGTLTIVEKCKHVYHSEPADLNGYVLFLT